jgi:PPOX class probable F420-dependent enzyme
MAHFAAVIVRDATAQDWPEIWPFVRQIVAAADTFAYDPRMDESEARSMWLQDPPGRTAVAVDSDGRIVGSANMYANHDGPGSHVASANFMVDPAHWGEGAGRALCEDALEWARDRGFRAMQFNAVAESNTRALALYRSLGFEVLATIPEGFRHPTKGHVGLCILHRRLWPDAEQLLAPVEAYLREPRCAVLSTIGADGAPHQAVVHYLPHTDGLVVNGRPDRRWALNLRRDPRASLVVHDADEPLHWVGLTGHAQLLRDGRAAVADAMEMASRYGEDPADYAEQERVSVLIRPRRVFEYGSARDSPHPAPR